MHLSEADGNLTALNNWLAKNLDHFIHWIFVILTEA